MDMPGPQYHEDMIEGIQLAPQLHSAERIVELTVDVLGHSFTKTLPRPAAKPLPAVPCETVSVAVSKWAGGICV